jgi:hypothetical protein
MVKSLYNRDMDVGKVSSEQTIDSSEAANDLEPI